MRMNERFSSPDGFRHQTRTLEAGEAIPRVPSLFEQLAALGGAKCTPLEASEEIIIEAPEEDLDADLE
jgi:hypothetical protein